MRFYCIQKLEEGIFILSVGTYLPNYMVSNSRTPLRSSNPNLRPRMPNLFHVIQDKPFLRLSYTKLRYSRFQNKSVLD
jgi:hypothetical protein